MKVIVVAHNQFKLVQMEIEALRLLAGIDEKDLVIVDNGSDDGLRQWLEERPGMNYLICDEGSESYSTIINYAKTEFQITDDLLLLNPCYAILPNSIEEMQKLLYSDREIGAVMPELIQNGSETAHDYAEAISCIQEGKLTSGMNLQKLELTDGCVMLKHSMLEKVGEFEEKLFLAENVMWDYCVRGIELHFKLFECGSAFFYQIDYCLTDELPENTGY